jgi:hypothetical protein
MSLLELLCVAFALNSFVLVVAKATSEQLDYDYDSEAEWVRLFM